MFISSCLSKIHVDSTDEGDSQIDADESSSRPPCEGSDTEGSDHATDEFDALQTMRYVICLSQCLK